MAELVFDNKKMSELVDALHVHDADVSLRLLDEAHRAGGSCGVRDIAKAAVKLGSNLTFSIEASPEKEVISISRNRYGYHATGPIVSLSMGRCERK